MEICELPAINVFLSLFKVSSILLINNFIKYREAKNNTIYFYMPLMNWFKMILLKQKHLLRVFSFSLSKSLTTENNFYGFY